MRSFMFPNGFAKCSRAAVAAFFGAMALAPTGAAAQNLGPFRQFLSVEPYYSFTRLDVGSAASPVNLQGYGARLWLNSAPFGVSDHVGVSLFVTRYPTQGKGANLTSYGGQLEIFPVHRPLGSWFDPYLSAGASAYRMNTFGGDIGVARGIETRPAVLPGAGVRVPIPNRFELRFEARDAIVFGSRLGTVAGTTRTANNAEFSAGLGLTF